MRLDNPSISGSITYLGGGTNTIEGTDASLTGSFTGSFDGDGTNITGIISSSYALTASHADNFNAASITASIISASYIDLDVLANGDIPDHKAGRIFFGAEDGALEVYNEEADITLQVGQEFFIRAFNPTGNTILNGTPVRASGSQGDRIAIYPALAEDHTTGTHFDSHIIGLATHDIGPSTEGYVTGQGIVRGVDTQAFSAGDTLYLQTGSAGLRNSPPPFPYDIVQVGYASKIASNGFIFVEPKEPVHFSNISGLSGSAQSPGDLWIYQANNAWSPGKTLSGSYTLSGSLTVTDEIVAQTLHVQQVTSSIVYSSGSNIFGDQLTDTHQFTGSVSITGSSTFSNYGDAHFLNGDMGIGTDSPNSLLHVSGSDQNILEVDSSNSDGPYTVYKTAGTIKGYIGNAQGIMNSGTGNFGIRAQGDLTFSSGGGTERMRIDSSGRVGIGVTPSDWSFTALQIKNSSLWSSGGDLGINANSYFDGSNYRYVGSSSASSRVYFNTDGSITFYQAPTGTAGDVVSFTERMSLNSGGNLKVNNRLLVNTTITDGQLNVEGTQPFLFKNSYGSLLYRDVSTTGIELHVRADQSKNTFVSFTENAVADKWVIKTLASDNSLYFSTGNPSSNTNRVTFDSSGNVSLSTGDLFINSGTSYNDKGYIYLSNQRTAIISDIVNLTANGDTSLDFQTRSGGSTASSMFIDEFRRVGIGTNDPGQKLHVDGAIRLTSNPTVTGDGASAQFWNQSGVGPTIAGNAFQVQINGTSPTLHINNSGLTGIGTTNPSQKVTIEVDASAYNALELRDSRAKSSTPEAALSFRGRYSGAALNTMGIIVGAYDNATDANTTSNMQFYINNGSSVVSAMKLQNDSSLAIANGAQSTDAISSQIIFGNRGYFSNPAVGGAKIVGVTGSPNWYSSTSLAFYTNPGPDVTSTGPTEKMRITGGGRVLIGTQNDNPAENNVTGVSFFEDGRQFISAENNEVMRINRKSSDGVIIYFHQDGTAEGNISVSGNTVSYNGFAGCHESSGIALDVEIGTVVSTIDELDTRIVNEVTQSIQDHAKIKVSDTVGDSRVYGVLQRYNDDGKPVVASVGIGSVLVTGSCAGGDLLESNGDGTAKIQDDDIIRSKTIGKVTIGNSNTEVKLVPIVLYCG